MAPTVQLRKPHNVRRLASNSLKSNNFIVYIIFGVAAFLVMLGFLFSLFLAPNETINAPGTNSIISSSFGEFSREALSKKILSWLPRRHSPETLGEDDTEEPDWSQEFWSPIDVEIAHDPMITLCKLNFQKYAQAPYLYPMFRELEKISSCHGSNRRKEKLSVLMAEIKSLEGKVAGRVVPPTGFVFHESRVGSTLVANALASDPWSMVYSESAPAANALLHFSNHVSRDNNVQIFRDIVTLMGRSPIHKRLFFKFQSITSTKMEIALQAFPNTSWAFVYRQPVQTMMSHLDPRKMLSGAPCLRSMNNPSKEVEQTLDEVVGRSFMRPREAWCAAHLNMLCNSALRAYEKFGTRLGGSSGNSVHQRGLLINYESLPGIIPSVMLPIFGASPTKRWVSKMESVTSFYSKGKGDQRKFTSDSADKEERATQAIQTYAQSILKPTYDKLLTGTLTGLQRCAPASYVLLTGMNSTITSSSAAGVGKVSAVVMVDPEELRWKELAKIRDINVAKETAGSSDGHNAIPPVMFEPWVPFSNKHNSRPYEKVDCPDRPPYGYPKEHPFLNITSNWNTDDVMIPVFHYDSLCHFDYQNPIDLKKAGNYRQAEKPFVIYNIPAVDAIVKKWGDIDYLHRRLGSKAYRTEKSKDNHFMYWNFHTRHLRDGKSWTPPTEIITEKFEKWLELAVKGQNITLENRAHEYFRVSSDMGNPWLFSELPFFQPKRSLWLVDPREQKGIHCRFGMRSVIAEAHFDGSRNTIVQLGGMRRWILTHPKECSKMYMLPRDHPSGRHSSVDWSKPDPDKYPDLKKLKANEVIMRPGDLLYLPTNWIHYIVSLNVNYQCNTRSGRTSHYDWDISRCGF